MGEGGVPYLAVRSARPSSYLSDPVVLLLPLLAYASSSSASSASASLDRHRGTPCLPLYPLSPALFGPRIFRRSPLVTHAMHPCCSSLGRLMSLSRLHVRARARDDRVHDGRAAAALAQRLVRRAGGGACGAATSAADSADIFEGRKRTRKRCPSSRKG